MNRNRWMWIYENRWIWMDRNRWIWMNRSHRNRRNIETSSCRNRLSRRSRRSRRSRPSRRRVKQKFGKGKIRAARLAGQPKFLNLIWETWKWWNFQNVELIFFNPFRKKSDKRANVDQECHAEAQSRTWSFLKNPEALGSACSAPPRDLPSSSGPPAVVIGINT